MDADVGSDAGKEGPAGDPKDDDDDDDDDVTFVNIREHVLDDSDACGGLHIDVSIVFAQ